MRKIEIGLLKNDPYWETILKQEGVPFEVVSEDLEKYTLLIANQMLDLGKKALVMDYLENGGLVLSFTVFFEENRHVKRVSSFVPSDNKFFKGVSSFSLYGKTYQIKDESYENVENIVFSKKVGKGKLILLSFDLSDMLEKLNYSPNPLFTPSGSVFQILPKVSRNSIRVLIRNCLIDLLNHADLPYVRLSNFPSGFKSAFVFRVDADNYNEKDFYETIRILSKHGIKASYFINQSSYTNNLEDLRRLKYLGFEVQSHMNKHCVYNSVRKNYENLSQSLDFLKEFNPNAFVAPFGIFNKSLLAAAEKLGMVYSSEFSYDYDNLPSFPIVNGRVSKVLQMPIHPVCLESFIEVGRGDDAILKHFDYTFEKAIKERMPIFWYGYSTRVFRDYPTYFRVFGKMVGKINKNNGTWKATFSEFYKWWVERLNFSYSVYSDGTGILVKFNRHFAVDLEIFYKGMFKVSNLRSRIDLKGMRNVQTPVEKERRQYARSFKDILSKLKLYLLNKYLNYKNMR